MRQDGAGVLERLLAELVSEFRLQRVATERLADAAERKRSGNLERRALAFLNAVYAAGGRMSRRALAAEMGCSPQAFSRYPKVLTALAAGRPGKMPRRGRRTVNERGRADGGIEAYEDGERDS